MAGLTHLSEILIKRGKDFVKNLLTKNTTVSEKLDGSNFNVKKIRNGFEYYKRDGRTPINVIDRTLSIYNEKPIQHFENLPRSVISEIPDGMYFSLEYFPRKKTVEIEYDSIPKSGLVLESVMDKNQNFVYEKDELDKWADLLKVERVPIIFQGFLTENQRKEILSFISTPFDDLIRNFETQSFSRFIIQLLNPEMKSSFFKSSIDDLIEGVVFNFKGDEDTILAKLVDPSFTLMAKEKAKSRVKTPNDIYGMIVSDISDFINTVDLSIYKLSGTDFSVRYIDLMSQLFLDYFNEKGEDFKDIDMKLPEFLNRPEHSVNIKAIPYKNISEIVKMNKNYAELYKIFIATFRKKKKRAVGYFTREFIGIFNNIVDKLHDYINVGINEISMEDINTFILYNEDEEVLQEYNVIEENQEYTIIEIPTELHEDIKNENKNELITTPAGTPINVIVGRFQPIHKGHISISKFLKEANGYDSIYVTIRGEKPNIKSPISLETQKEIFKVVEENEDCVINFMQTNRVILNEIFTLLRKDGYEPMSLGAGDDRVEAYREQLNFMIEKRNNMMNVNEDFSIIQIPRNIIKVSGTSVRESIISDDQLTFNKQMPEYLHIFYDKIKKDLVKEYEIEGKVELKLSKKDSPGIYSIKENNGITKIKINPVIAAKVEELINKK